MTQDSGFPPRPTQPKNWADIFSLTNGLSGVPIEEIEQGRPDWEYDFGGKDMRPCGRLGCAQDHGHGWLVALTGQRFVHVGHVCAAKHANATVWTGKVNAYRAERRASAREAAIVEARQAASAILSELEAWKEADRAISLHESFCQQAIGPFLNSIVDRAGRGKNQVEIEYQLTADEMKIRRAQATAARLADDDRPDPYVAPTETRRIGTIAGLEAFRAARDPRYLRLQLQRLAARLAEGVPETAPDGAIKALQQDARELVPLRRDLVACVDATLRFFTQRNLDLLVNLTEARPQGIRSIKLTGQDAVTVERRTGWR